MCKQLLLTIVCSFTLIGSVYAQSTVTGSVTDARTGESLPGVNILISELQQGTATDIDGNYTISNVPAGTYTLVATFVGYQRYEASIEVTSQGAEHDIILDQRVVGLEDVVVTAFGISRERRALGYGVSEVGSESIERRQEVDLARSLTGKLPGVDVSATGGVTGSGTDIVIRGFTTMTGSNAPLFIVDGVRFDGDRNTTDNWAQGGGATVTPNRFLDIDPSNIENVTVLKGLSAAVLYGEQGRNGVILIDTKSGSFQEDRAPGFQVSLNQSVYATQISSRPDYQNTYGNGFDQAFGWFFSNWGPRFTATDPALFGSLFQGYDDDGTVLVNHPLTNHGPTAEAFPEFADVGYRYEAKPDPLEAFFRTGLASTSSMNISGGIEDLQLNVTYSRTGEEGFTPENNLTRDSFSMGANYRINDRLFAETSFNMSLTDMDTPPLAAGGGSGPAAVGGTTSVFADVFYTPRSVDLDIPHQNPVTGGSAYYRAGNDIPHPRWTTENVGITNNTNRYFGKTELNYQVVENINLVYRLGYDSYTESREYRQNPGGVRPDGLLDGFYQTIEHQRWSWDHNLLALIDYQLTEDFSFNATAGAQYTTSRQERQGVESQNMIIFDFFKHSNFTSQSATNFFTNPTLDLQRLVEQQTVGVFADATVGYQDFVYLNVAGRNDWFSTLEEDNRSIFYPSASISYIASDHLDITSDALTYLKLYAGVGSSAGSPSPYSTRNVLSSNARAFVTQDGTVVTSNATDSFLGNPNLKPELHTEYEAGIDVRFFDGRLGLDITGYTRKTTDLITAAPLDPGTGFTSTFVNIGEIQNQGIELTLLGTPIIGDFRWDMQGNFYTYKSEVNELGEGLDRIQVGGGFDTRGNFAIPGEPFMVMMGTKIVRNDQGVPVIGSTGNYIDQEEIGIIGNPHPDFKTSLSNTFYYKGASLSFQFDYQQGGDMYSTWIGTLMARGLTTDTEQVDRNNTFILPGVNEAGNPNKVQISPSGVFFDNFGFGADELQVYDMTHIRLSEVSLSYDLPSSILAQSPFTQIRLSVNGTNLWMFAFNVPEGSGFDPNVNSIGGNSRGFEYLTGPAVRRFGGSVRVRF
ncbi:MAG: SusC/RagA family TonB-linked outer membrane protein [Balneolaceae bacterium]